MGIQPTAHASADIFGIKLFDENVVLATFKQKLVNDACVAYTGPIPTDSDNRSKTEEAIAKESRNMTKLAVGVLCGIAFAVVGAQALAETKAAPVTSTKASSSSA